MQLENVMVFELLKKAIEQVAGKLSNDERSELIGMLGGTEQVEPTEPEETPE